MKAWIYVGLLLLPSLGFGFESWVGLSLGAGQMSSKSLRSGAFSYYGLTEAGGIAGLKFGGGVRYTMISRGGPLALGESRGFEVAEVSLGAANLFGTVEYAAGESWGLGMNIDLIGLTTGKSVKLSSTSALGEARPVSSNRFLFGKKDQGSLNSEFFIYYQTTPGSRLALGFSHQVIEYEAETAQTEKLQRFYDLLFFRLDL